MSQQLMFFQNSLRRQQYERQYHYQEKDPSINDQHMDVMNSFNNHSGDRTSNTVSAGNTGSWIGNNITTAPLSHRAKLEQQQQQQQPQNCLDLNRYQFHPIGTGTEPHQPQQHQRQHRNFVPNRPLHAGQLRFHSFTKLRELQNARKQLPISLSPVFSKSPLFRTTVPLGGASLVVNQSERLFWTDTTQRLSSLVFSRNKLQQLEEEANKNLSDGMLQYKFLYELAKEHPLSVIERIRHPDCKGAAVNVQSAMLYLQILQQYNQSQYLDVDDILKRLALHYRIPSIGNDYKNFTMAKDGSNSSSSTDGDTAVVRERKLSKAEHLEQMMHFLHKSMTSGALGAAATAAASAGSSSFGRLGIGGGAGGGLSQFLQGTSEKAPVHVQIVPPSKVGMMSLSMLGSLARFFIVIAAVGALLDDRGLGRGIPGIGGSTKHIQEADTTVNGPGGNKRKVKFDDVKGVAEAKAELEEIVMYLKDPSKFTRLGGTLPRGLLLTGPPGTGKTLLAKAIAGEANVPFFYSSGSQFEEVYVGLGAKRVRELFEAAKKKAPAIIFIDEIDAVGGTRRLKDQSALKMTLNELLVQLDGFDENNGIIVIGATNFVESLDAALLRPGRFDKLVVVPLPDVGGRKEILEMYAKKTKLTPDADLNVLARGTTGMSGADLYNLMNQAALKASIDGLPAVDMKSLEYAKDKILMGAERTTAVITAETAKCTAYHEAGHALVAVLTEGALPIHKATIMPRGNALGMVTMLPESDQKSESYKQMMAYLAVAMGGRVAEELVFGKDYITSGAASDIKAATRMARSMVTKYGFSDSIGIVYHGGSSGEESASDETRALIDSEVKKLTDSAYERAKEIITTHKEEHELLAETLLEYETLTGDEVRDLILKHQKPKRPIINKDKGARGDSTFLKSKDNSGSDEAKEVKEGRRRKGLFGQIGPASQ